MKSIAIADDLLIATELIPGSTIFVGVATSMVTVTLDSHVRVGGVVQARSRSDVRCRVELQSGWPSGRPAADALAEGSLLHQPAVWTSNGTIDVPASGESLPKTFDLAGSQMFRFLFPMVRVRWVLSTQSGGPLLSSDHVVVSAQIRPYSE